jgi:hypothetical protein
MHRQEARLPVDELPERDATMPVIDADQADAIYQAAIDDDGRQRIKTARLTAVIDLTSFDKRATDAVMNLPPASPGDSR